MPDLQALEEAYQRGALPPDMRAAYEELRSRPGFSLQAASSSTPKPGPSLPSAPEPSLSEQLEDAKKGIPRALEEGVIGLATGIPTLLQMGAGLAKNAAKDYNIPGH